jgi:hypothetical protein
MTNDLNSPLRGIGGFLELLKTDIIHSLQANGKMATGQTAQQITVISDDDSARLEVPGYIQLLESGRGPTSADAIPGDPPMIERIKAWCQAKGIPDSAAWAIKHSIDKNGFKGVPGILSQPLGDDNINMRLAPAAEKIAGDIVQQIINSLGLER